ncbi:uncharacterized protein MAM_08388 [Metarhizium album ARSEF 1941]|uniref:Uncharacterized protein n=1 Tax=Metarhizium album (strain ARSEF 1941) TaxID=1081103 RepID=A0A0B2WJX6_METAS|nr:uncharacterized protein MAM_08388 [Metarhizium album ARSEF 1941]KHN93747.1 hypothetical protein MAM_08388 [Metarhizium album ARSEF 1941]
MFRLVSVLVLVGTCWAAKTPARGDQLADFINQLKKSLHNVDQRNPPFYDEPKLKEATCPSVAWDCLTTEFWTRLTIVDVPHQIAISTNTHTDALLANSGSQDAVIKSQTSTAVAQGTTTGWTIGGQVKVAAPKDVLEAELSASYNDQSTSMTTETKSIEYDATCPAGKTCRIQTVTFRAEIQASCKTDAYFACKDALNICERPRGTLTCQQFVDYYNRNCLDAQRYQPCSVDVQLRQDDGSLLTLVVITEDSA